MVYARLVKHRSDAMRLIDEGRVRVNRVRIEKLSQNVKPNDVITVALVSGVKVLRVLGEAERRGSATAASLLYEDVGESA